MSGQVCQHCGENPATIHFTEIKEEERTELHVCEECAAAQGITPEGNVPTILAGVVAAHARNAELESKTCPHCGITFAEFRRRGRLGCPRDYEVFEELLKPMLSKMHAGAEGHVGRLPRGRTHIETERPDKLLRLRRDLQTAINEERYEHAAGLRDKIIELETDPVQRGGATPGLLDGELDSPGVLNPGKTSPGDTAPDAGSPGAGGASDPGGAGGLGGAGDPDWGV